MEEFWKWLMRTNARGVFFCSLLALVVVTAWWIWKEFAPIKGKVRVLPMTAQEKPRVGLGLLTLIEKQSSTGAVRAPGNSFLSSPSPPQNRTPKYSRLNGFKRWLTTRKPQKPIQKPEKPKPQKAAWKPETVSLTYKGVFKRPDGKVMALIEDSKTKSSSFYTSGDELHGVKIGEIGMKEVGVILADESSVPLRLGEPEVFEGGRHED